MLSTPVTPFCPVPVRLLCGRNSAGLWVLQSVDGGYGCLFPSREAALEEAIIENDGEPVEVTFPRMPVELDFQPHPELLAVARRPASPGGGKPCRQVSDRRLTTPDPPVRRDHRAGRPPLGLSGFVTGSLLMIVAAAGLIASTHP
jgi:hypothetical protein